jgi:hypothetical protein
VAARPGEQQVRLRAASGRPPSEAFGARHTTGPAGTQLAASRRSFSLKSPGADRTSARRRRGATAGAWARQVRGRRDSVRFVFGSWRPDGPLILSLSRLVVLLCLPGARRFTLLLSPSPRTRCHYMDPVVPTPSISLLYVQRTQVCVPEVGQAAFERPRTLNCSLALNPARSRKNRLPAHPTATFPHPHTSLAVSARIHLTFAPKRIYSDVADQREGKLP